MLRFETTTGEPRSMLGTAAGGRFRDDDASLSHGPPPNDGSSINEELVGAGDRKDRPVTNTDRSGLGAKSMLDSLAFRLWDLGAPELIEFDDVFQVILDGVVGRGGTAMG